MFKILPLTLLIFFCVSNKANAQYDAPFAIIKDTDSFTNVRANNSAGSAIIDKLSKNQVFEDERQFGNSQNTEWYYISYANPKKANILNNKIAEEKTGYIHKSRILYLNKLPHLKRIVIGDTLVKFTNDSIEIAVKLGRFISKNHTIHLRDSYVDKIDGSTPWGFDGIMPSKLIEIKFITIIYKNKRFTFSKENLANIFSPSAFNMKVAISNNNTMFLTMSNGDGAGAYNVVWTIKDNSVVSQFINIDF